MCEAFVVDGLPFNLANRFHFRRFISYLLPEFEHKSAQTMKRRIMNMYESGKKKINKELSGKVFLSTAFVIILHDLL